MTANNNIISITHSPPKRIIPAAVNDFRTSKRFDHEAHLIVKNFDCGRYTYGRMYNYSRGGIYFESDAAFKPGSRVRIDLEDSQSGLAADHYFATVRWCKQICDAVVLYDFAVGIEFDREMNRIAGSGKLRIIQGGLAKERAEQT